MPSWEGALKRERAAQVSPAVRGVSGAGGGPADRGNSGRRTLRGRSRLSGLLFSRRGNLVPAAFHGNRAQLGTSREDRASRRTPLQQARRLRLPPAEPRPPQAAPARPALPRPAPRRSSPPRPRRLQQLQRQQ
ncbi:hypothetical protein J1605_008315 [Eschrichtius robustus]|uniref:Uncharacterized protein n=1 Tax=Eschrichtius robustus TaxID=9764 RepID=A0AB34GV81_ESCRO|nr:hypothetical protein J1605_008315 [Eschrichtius robustus]